MKIKRIIILVVVALIVISAGVFGGIKIKNYLPFYYDKNGIKQPDTEYTLTIEKSDFENEVAKKLQEEGIVISAVRFLGFIKENYPDFVWYNGQYELSADMSYKEICEKLQNPDKKIEYVKFTVPEGKTVKEIAQIVEKSGLCTKEEFLKAADSYDYDVSFIGELKNRNQSKIAYKLEGFLFPATYEFRKDNVTAGQIVEKMLKTFSDYVTDDMIQKAKEKGLSINELVTFGSVIQAEAFSKESMANISSVFWNRLNSKSYPNLQSDPTMFYAEDLEKLPHYTKEMANAYNTYVCKDLPIGPTNCPGIDVIKAVLEPSDTDYFYFVTDSNGKFYYNETLSGHNSTIKMLVKQGIWG